MWSKCTASKGMRGAVTVQLTRFERDMIIRREPVLWAQGGWTFLRVKAPWKLLGQGGVSTGGGACNRNHHTRRPTRQWKDLIGR